MAVDEAALDRLRDELLAAMREYGAGLEARLGARIDASAVETRRYVDTSAAETRQYVDASAAETRRYIDASAAETRRHMDVVAEDLRSKLSLVAEGVVTLTERLGSEMRDGFDVVDRRLLRLETRLLSTPERG